MFGDQDQDQLPPLPPGAVPIEDTTQQPPLPRGATPFEARGLNLLPNPPAESHPNPQQMDQAFRDVAAAAADYAPATLAALGALTQPEFWPAVGMATLGGGIGSGVKQLTHAAVGSKKAPKDFTEAAKTAAIDAGEQGLMEFGGQAVAKPLEWGLKKAVSSLDPFHLYQSSLKPSTRLAPEDARAIITTGLENRIPVSEAGYYKTGAATDALQKQIDAMIKGKSDQLGAIIDPRSVAGRTGETSEFFEKQADPQADLNAIAGVKDRFLERHTTYAPYTEIRPTTAGEGLGDVTPVGKIGGAREPYIQNLTAEEAQELKKGTYRQLRDKAYGELKPAEVEAQKAIARGLREDLGKLFPGLNDLNAKDKALIDLEHELARYVMRYGNRQKIGISEGIVMGAGAAAGHPVPGMALGFLKRAIDDPAVKSKLAIALYNGTKLGRVIKGLPKVPIRIVPNAMRAVQPMVLDTKDIPIAWARGGRMRDPLLRQPDRAAILRSLGK